MQNQHIEIRDLREKQFFMVDDAYLNGYARLCGINATGVYLSLCRHASKSQTCFPSKKLIAEELSISERSVYTALKKLEDWNIITIDNQGRKGDGSFKSKIYTLVSKKHWKSKPQANGADGKIRHSPQANNDIHRRHVLPNKGTHIEGNTIEGVVAHAPTPAQEAIDFFSNQNRQADVTALLVKRGVPEEAARSEIRKFVSYWTELNKNGTKQRWQLQPTFDVRRRLVTWLGKSGGTKSPYSPVKTFIL